MANDLDLAFRKLIVASGLPLKKFAEATETSAYSTLKWWNADKETFLTDKQIESFQNHFAMIPENIFENKEQIALLRKRIYNSPISLPEKYEENPDSFVRSTHYILEYLKLLHGQAFVDNLVISLNVHPIYLENLDNKINVKFITDLLTQCKELGFSKSDFNSLAGSLFLSIENTEKEELFSNVASYEEFYTSLSKVASHFDKNFTYDFIIGKTGADFITRPTDHLVQYLQKSNLDVSILYDYRPLLFAQAPLISQMPGLDIKIKSCISRGDRLSRYQVQFPSVSLNII